MEFPNGYRVSVVFAPGNYGDHHDNTGDMMEHSLNPPQEWDSRTAELAVFKPEGGLLDFGDEGDQVRGWINPAFVSEMFGLAAKGDEEGMKELAMKSHLYGAEGLEFTDWANQETKHHGKTSLKDWADHEIKTHGGKMSFQDWAKHEDKSHIRRYGAESIEVWEMIQQNLNNPDAVREFYRVLVGDPDEFTGDDMALVVAEAYQQNDNSQEFVDWVHKELFSAESFSAEELKRKSCCCGATKTHPCACMIQGIMKCSDSCPCSLEKKGAEGFVYFYTLDEDGFGDHYDTLEEAQAAVAASSKPMEIYERREDIHEPYKMDKRMGAENWGGDPKGKLAQALAKAREKAKKVGKTLKIEKLGADSGWNMPPGVFSIPEPEHWGDYDLRHEYDYENYLDLELWKEAGLTEPEEYEVFYDRKEEEAKRIAEEEAKEEMKRDREDAWNLGYACKYDEYPHEWAEYRLNHPNIGKTDGFQCSGCGEWRQTIEDDRNAETSGQWEIDQQLSQEGNYGEGRDFNAESFTAEQKCPTCKSDESQYTEYHKCGDCGIIVCEPNGCGLVAQDSPWNNQWDWLCNTCYDEDIKEGENSYRHRYSIFNAESFSATKGIDTFTEPFDELSLDSGNIKKVIVGIGIGVAGILAYNKWK